MPAAPRFEASTCGEMYKQLRRTLGMHAHNHVSPPVVSLRNGGAYNAAA